MAPKTRAKSATAGAKDSNLKQKIKSKLYIYTREDDSKNTKRCRHCVASVRSEDAETTLQDTANAAANVSAAPVDPRDSAEVPSPAVLPEWNGRRRRIACSKNFYFQYTNKQYSGLLTKDEVEVVDFLVTEGFRRKWASGSATATLVQMKKDLIYFVPVQKVSSKAEPGSSGPWFKGTCGFPIQAYSTVVLSSLQPKFC